MSNFGRTGVVLTSLTKWNQIWLMISRNSCQRLFPDIHQQSQCCWVHTYTNYSKLEKKIDGVTPRRRRPSIRQGWKRLCLFSSFAFWQRIRTQLIRNALWPTHVCHKEEYAPRVFFSASRQLLTANELFWKPFHSMHSY